MYAAQLNTFKAFGHLLFNYIKTHKTNIKSVLNTTFCVLFLSATFVRIVFRPDQYVGSYSRHSPN
jgi:hypothetical protein